MAGPTVKSEDSATPLPPTLKRSTSSSQSTGKNQKSILGFFQKRTTDALQPTINEASRPNASSTAQNGSCKKKLVQRSPVKTSQSLTPIPSSDGPADDPEEDQMEVDNVSKSNGIRLPITPASAKAAKAAPSSSAAATFSSPSRKVCTSYPGTLFDSQC